LQMPRLLYDSQAQLPDGQSNGIAVWDPNMAWYMDPMICVSLTLSI
jgi:hypothetical protein